MPLLRLFLGLRQWLTSILRRLFFITEHNILPFSTAITNDLYPLGVHGLTLGRRVLPGSNLTYHNNMRDQNSSSNDHLYHPKPGVYTVGEIVHLTVPLLDTVIQRLGPDEATGHGAREILIQGLAASLAPNGRESTLPLSYGSSDTSRKEVAWQVRAIGQSIVEFVREASNTSNADPELQLRSQCDGHLWTSAVAALLLGPRSHGALLELYNEWLHRMVLLRDALLCFENYKDVPLVFLPGPQSGLRSFENDRKLFLLECLSGNIAHSAIVDLAKSFTAPGLPRGGYGLQYSQGVILPAFLSGSQSLHLLRYHPARIEDTNINLLFDYQYPVYKSLRHEIPGSQGDIAPGVWPPPSLMSLEPRVSRSKIGIDAGCDTARRTLSLELVLDSSTTVTVDLGQITRGQRHAYRVDSRSLSDKDGGTTTEPSDAAETRKDFALPKSNFELDEKSKTHVDSSGPTLTPPSSPDVSPSSTPRSSVLRWKHVPNTRIHRTADILKQPGLLASSENGQIHIFPASDPLISLALLGKLYPENVILADEADRNPEAVGRTGKGYGARLLLWQESKRTTVDSSVHVET